MYKDIKESEGTGIIQDRREPVCKWQEDSGLRYAGHG